MHAMNRPYLTPAILRNNYTKNDRLQETIGIYSLNDMQYNVWQNKSVIDSGAESQG
jgi:hypothetical protein